MKSLIIGMGIGQLYKTVLEEPGYEVVTADINPNAVADFVNYEDAFAAHGNFDTVHICTPNYTHEKIARYAGSRSAGIVFIEKPGVSDHLVLQAIKRDYPETRFLMVKNNQFRDEITKYRDLAAKSQLVHIRWNNNNRIPSPGSWFTTKKLAYGGVSRDLIPHMLSYYCAIADYTKGIKLYAKATQRWQLEEIDSTDYGTIYADGIYDVDDFCEIEFNNNGVKYILTANWRSLGETDISISFGDNSSAVRYELGLCPESAYKKMIETAVSNLNNDSYWQEQFAQDIWIHKQIENL